jgi:hypothetical protein
MPVERRAYTIKEYCAAYRVGRTSVWRDIKEGRLAVTKTGRRITIPVESAEARNKPRTARPRRKAG